MTMSEKRTAVRCCCRLAVVAVVDVVDSVDVVAGKIANLSNFVLSSHLIMTICKCCIFPFFFLLMLLPCCCAATVVVVCAIVAPSFYCYSVVRCDFLYYLKCAV